MTTTADHVDLTAVFSVTQFTFAKIWLLYSQFEIRQKNLQGARKVMVRLAYVFQTWLTLENEMLSN